MDFIDILCDMIYINKLISEDIKKNKQIDIYLIKNRMDNVRNIFILVLLLKEMIIWLT